MSLKIKIDTATLASQCKAMAIEAKQDLEKGVQRLAAATVAHVRLEAEEKLSGPTYLKFNKSIGYDDPAPGIHVISIDDKGMWVEEGLKPNFDMKPGLLKDAKDINKRGYKYRAIPFDQGKSKTTATGYEWNLRQRVKSELAKAKIPYKKIEKDAEGKAKLGLLHRLNFGGEIPGKGNTPVLQGVSIYQTLTKTGNVRRDILTFRTVSGDPKSASANKWFHPGYEAKKFLDSAQVWAEKEWETTILPEILARWKE